MAQQSLGEMAVSLAAAASLVLSIMVLFVRSDTPRYRGTFKLKRNEFWVGDVFFFIKITTCLNSLKMKFIKIVFSLLSYSCVLLFYIVLSFLKKKPSCLELLPRVGIKKD